MTKTAKSAPIKARAKQDGVATVRKATLRKRPVVPSVGTSSTPNDELAANIKDAYERGILFTRLNGKVPVLKDWTNRPRARSPNL